MREALSETATAAVPDAVRVQEKDKPFSHFTLGCSKETGAQGEGIAEGFRACGRVCVCVFAFERYPLGTAGTTLLYPSP